MKDNIFAEEIGKLKEAEKALRDYDERYHAVFIQSPFGILIVDPNTAMPVEFNDAACRQLGYTSDEFAKLRVSDYEAMKKPEEIEKHIKKLLLEMSDEFETKHRTKTGEIRDVIVSAQVIEIQGRPYIYYIHRDVTESKKADETIRRMAYVDPLTNLPNKAALHRIISNSIEESNVYKRSFAFFMLDITKFRDINDALGHRQGDELLKEVGIRLKGLLKGEQALARFGADEFAILMPGADSEDAISFAKEILKILDAPFDLSGLKLYVQASMGIVLFPGHGSDADLLIRRVEMAMFRAKKEGIGYSVYTGEFENGLTRRLALAGDLRYCIEDNSGLLLYCQPKVDIQSGKLSGAEVLLRWQHPEKGMIFPDEFISIAEHTGLIKPLTYWVLEASIRQCFVWQAEKLEVPLAVNLSVRNLHDPNLLKKMRGLIATWGINPAGLEMELTESAFTDEPVVYSTLTQIRNIGVNIFIDDFGTGYSSLSYLQRLPINAIKIDKSFVSSMIKDAKSANIVKSTIGLAHNMGLKVVAEGVEDRATYDMLSECGCNEAQGYYISKPMPVEGFREWMEKSSWK